MDDLEPLIKSALEAQTASQQAETANSLAREALETALKDHPMIGHVLTYTEKRGYGSKETMINRKMMVERVTYYSNGWGEKVLLREPMAIGRPVLADGSKGVMLIDKMISACADAGMYVPKGSR